MSIIETYCHDCGEKTETAEWSHGVLCCMECGEGGTNV
jgi:hypothetical protein